MKYNFEKKFLVSILILGLFVVVTYAVVSDFGGCGTSSSCISVLLFGYPYQAYFLPLLAVLLSLTPLFFTPERAYETWRKFAVWAVPLMLVLIFASPVHDSGNWGLNLDLTREMAALLYSGLFLLISWALTLRAVLAHR